MAQHTLLGGAVGVLFGLVGGLRWVIALAAAGGPQSSAVAWLQVHWVAVGITLALLTAMVLRLAGVVLRVSAGQGVAVGASVVLGALAYGGVVWTAATVQIALPGAWVYAVSLGLGLVAVGCRSRSRMLATAGLLLAAGFAPWSRSLHLLSGDDLAGQALCYAPPPSLSYFASMGISMLSIGLFVGAAFGLVTQGHLPRTAGIGALTGLLVAACGSATQEIVFLTAMRSGQDPIAIVVAMAGACAGVWALAGLSVSGWCVPGAPRILKIVPAATALTVVAYAFSALYGYSDYQALSRLHPDGLFAYVHFVADGSWQRTLDQSACPTKTRRAQEFLLRYPASAYRPAALLTTAQSQFEEWRFGDSASVLALSSQEYPLLDGYRDLLQAFADFANGRTGAMLRPVPEGSYLAEWRQTVGAQTAAYAAERLGLPRRAYGLHSGYVDYLAARNPSSWSGDSAAYSRSRMDVLLPQMDLRRISRGTVRIRVAGPAGPIRDARVVLVQPHPNAALPSDSVQFTGAWSIPAWNGSWALTGRDGVATIPDVPYGRYEVVLGLGLAAWPAGTVAQSGPCGIAVEQPLTECDPIRLVPAVRQLRPAPGSNVTPPVTLRWRRYPGAHHYSATLIAVRPSTAESGKPAVVRGTTCWAKARIAGESTTIDGDHFVNGHTELSEGSSYMWLVYAYGSDDRLLSSSEHYFELREPTFSTRVRDARNGGLRR